MTNNEAEQTARGWVFGELEEGWEAAKEEETRVKTEAESLVRKGIREAKESAEQAREGFLSGVADAVNTGRASLNEAKDYLSQWFEIVDTKWEAVEQIQEIAQPGAPILFVEEENYQLTSVSKTPGVWFSGGSSYFEGKGLDLGLSVVVKDRKEPVEFTVYNSQPGWGNVLIGEDQIKHAVSEKIQASGPEVVYSAAPVIAKLVNMGFEFADDSVELLRDKARNSLELYRWHDSQDLNLRIKIDTGRGAWRISEVITTIREYYPDVYEELVNKAAVLVASKLDFAESRENRLLLEAIYTEDSDNDEQQSPVEFHKKTYELAKRGQAILGDEDTLKDLIAD